MNGRPVISIIVVTVNTPKLTKACLESIVRNTSVPYELVVVNNSRAKSIRNCLRKFPQCHVIQNLKNIGYARAANQGALVTHGEFLCFLNSDTIVPPGWMERLLDVARQPGVGAVGPIIRNLKYRYVRTPRGIFADNTVIAMIDKGFQEWYAGQTKKVPWLMGFCLLVPRPVMGQVGLFDEQFFFGLEDDDYALRLRLKGYHLLGVESLFVHHKGGGSASLRKRQQWIRQAERLFLLKWQRVLERKFSNRQAVYAAVNRICKTKILPLPLLPMRSFNDVSRIIRTGFSIRSASDNRIGTLVRLSDLEIFEPNQKMKKVWKTLEGSIPSNRIHKCLKNKDLKSHKIRSYLSTLTEEGLAARIQPAPQRHPLVTVMMAARNAERWIGEAIESVLTQTLKKFELIIVDDGSTDRTVQVIDRYRWHPQLRFFQNPRQLGIAATRNRILSLARGRYIAVCDADDMMRSGLLERFTGILENHPKIGWIWGDFLVIDALGQRLNILQALPLDGHRELQRNIIGHGGALIRKDAMLKVGGYDETLISSEDHDLALKISEKTQMLALSGEIYYLWRRHDNSISRDHSPNPWAIHETRRLVADALRRRQSHPE